MSNLQHTETQFYNTQKFEEIDDIKEALNKLYDKLENVTRQVSFWDIYNVTQVLLSDSDITSKLALLNIGESAIVNANSITNGKDTYYRGDVIYKQLDGNLLYIPAENKGIYQPTITYDTDNDQLTLSYKYNSTPKEGLIESIIKIDTSQSAYLLDEPISSFEPSPEQNPTYLIKRFSSVKIDGTSILKPLIKFYIKSESGYEEFYANWKWTYDDVEDEIVVKIEYFNTSEPIFSDIVMRVR